MNTCGTYGGRRSGDHFVLFHRVESCGFSRFRHAGSSAALAATNRGRRSAIHHDFAMGESYFWVTAGWRFHARMPPAWLYTSRNRAFLSMPQARASDGAAAGTRIACPEFLDFLEPAASWQSECASLGICQPRFLVLAYIEYQRVVVIQAVAFSVSPVRAGERTPMNSTSMALTPRPAPPASSFPAGIACP